MHRLAKMQGRGPRLADAGDALEPEAQGAAQIGMSSGLIGQWAGKHADIIAIMAR